MFYDIHCMDVIDKDVCSVREAIYYICFGIEPHSKYDEVLAKNLFETLRKHGRLNFSRAELPDWVPLQIHWQKEDYTYCLDTPFFLLKEAHIFKEMKFYYLEIDLHQRNYLVSFPEKFYQTHAEYSMNIEEDFKNTFVDIKELKTLFTKHPRASDWERESKIKNNPFGKASICTMQNQVIPTGQTHIQGCDPSIELCLEIQGKKLFVIDKGERTEIKTLGKGKITYFLLRYLLAFPNDAIPFKALNCFIEVLSESKGFRSSVNITTPGNFKAAIKDALRCTNNNAKEKIGNICKRYDAKSLVDVLFEIRNSEYYCYRPKRLQTL